MTTATETKRGCSNAADGVDRGCREGAPAVTRRGFASIGLVRPKSHHNVGSVLRAAFCYGAAMVAIQGDRSDVRSHLDTFKSWRHIPVLRGDDLHALIPFDAVPIAVDLVPDAVPLPAFQHPQRAFYVFGPEDGTLGRSHLDWCVHRVMVPTRECMNLAATVNVVLYDRAAKMHRMERGISNARVAPMAALSSGRAPAVRGAAEPLPPHGVP